jgi:hypothetical protein
MGSGSGLTGERKKQRLKAAVFLELKNHTSQPGATTENLSLSPSAIRTISSALGCLFTHTTQPNQSAPDHHRFFLKASAKNMDF